MICFNDEHPEKAEFPIEVTEEGIVICVNEKDNWDNINPLLFFCLQIIDSISFGKKKKFNESTTVSLNYYKNDFTNKNHS